MTSTRSTQTRTLARGVAIAMVIALSLTGCSKNVASDQAATTGGDSGKSTLELSDLKGLLPKASKVGADYRVSDENDSDDTEGDTDGDTGNVEEDPYDAAFAKACPDAARLMDEDEGSESVDRAYTADDEREVDVSLGLTNPATGDRALDEMRKAFSSCKTVRASDEDISYTIDVDAEKDNDYGDKGVMVSMDFTFTPEAGGFDPFKLHLKMRLFRVGAVTIMISVQSGLDTSTLTEVPGDFGLLDSLGADLEMGASDLQK